MEADASRSSSTASLSIVEARPFSRPATSSSRPRFLPELATCLLLPRLCSLFSFSLVRALEQTTPDPKSAQTTPWFSNPSHPKFLHLPSSLLGPSLSPAEPYLGRKLAPVPPASIKLRRNSGCTSIRPSGPSPSNLGIRIDSPRLTDAHARLVPSRSRRFRARSRAMPAAGPCSTSASRLRPSQPAPSTP